MNEDRRAERRRQIEAAAHELLRERGFMSTSMLDIAKRARASNETLYRWYGDKTALFAALVERNAAASLEKLREPASSGQSLQERLTDFGTALLIGILSDEAIALNRAAAADPGGGLGAALARHGREAVVGILQDLLAASGIGTCFDGVEDAAETFLSLLTGDLPSRRTIGRLSEPDHAFCQARAAKAACRFLFLNGGPVPA